MNGPGPNDFHIENGVQKPGLGADEPSVKERAKMAEASEAERRRHEAIARTEQLLQTEAELLEQKRVALEARENRLRELERDLIAAGITVDQE
jgi:hypothetical protein